VLEESRMDSDEEFIDYSQVYLDMALQLRQQINEITRLHPWLLEYSTLGTILDYIHCVYNNKNHRLFKLNPTTRKQREQIAEFIAEHDALISTLHNVFQNVTHAAIDNQAFTNFIVKYSHTATRGY
jgi:hypothetical protein